MKRHQMQKRMIMAPKVGSFVLSKLQHNTLGLGKAIEFMEFFSGPAMMTKYTQHVFLTTQREEWSVMIIFFHTFSDIFHPFSIHGLNCIVRVNLHVPYEIVWFSRKQANILINNCWRYVKRDIRISVVKK